LDIADKCAVISDTVQKHYEEVSIIERAVEVARSNLENHSRSFEHKHGETRTWAAGILQEQKTAADGINTGIDNLANIPIKDEFLNFLTGPDGGAKGEKINKSGTPANLTAFIDIENIRKAGSAGNTLSQDFEKKITDLDNAASTVSTATKELVEDIREQAAASMAGENVEACRRLMEEIEVVAKKVSSDYEHVLGLPKVPKSVPQASKMALVHTKEYLPSLNECAFEMNDLLQQAVELKNTASIHFIVHMQSVSSIESMLSKVNKQMERIDVDEKLIQALELLGMLPRLPFVYGSLLVESVRRREWVEKIRNDSSMLAEEIATLKEEEERRRKKWQKSAGGVITFDVTDSKAMGVEITLQGEERQMPAVSRQDVQDYATSLQKIEGMSDIAKDISQLLKDLDKPTKAQTKRIKGFINGSVHEASALGRSSMMLRPNDDYTRKLIDEKTKVEDKLKGSESRIRKLEDLLHRQANVSRQMTGNVFHVTSPSMAEAHMPMSPKMQDNLSRRSSVSSRRFSMNQSPDDHAFAQKILSLEAELMAERENSAGLAKEVAARSGRETEFKGRTEEAESTKRDLMANLDAQQREFQDERKGLTDEISELKIKLEEIEDELERVLGSKDNVHKLQKDVTDEMEKLRADLEQARVSASKTNADLQKANDEKASLHRQVRDLEDQLQTEVTARQNQRETEVEHMKGLKAAHLQLAPANVAAPDEYSILVEAIENLADHAANTLKNLENELAITRADVDSLNRKGKDFQIEISTSKDKLKSEEIESFNLREKLAGEKSRLEATHAELENERSQIASLRNKFAEGETGSSALKDRLAEEERKAQSLSEQLAVEKSNVQSLETELGRVRSTQDESDSLSSRYIGRNQRAKDLTHRLYTYNDRLRRLLEALGFAITLREDNTVAIVRASRTANSITEADPNSGLTRNSSGAVVTRKAFEDDADLGLLFWMDAQTSEAEAEQFSAYLNAISRLDLDMVSEAITRRLKEVEHLARKLQKDARAYRDKSHRFQSEAHEKIAYRSFKEGDLALFLPTKNQVTRPWAAFNVGAPHYFLREQDSHKLRTRDWLLARISKVEERVVDLSKSMAGISDAGSFDDGTENPFQLSDGLRWYLLDAAEEKPGAPSTPGLGKSTVASAHVDAKGSMLHSRVKKSNSGASKTLSKSLASRRSSSNSKKDVHVENAPASGEGSRATTSAGVPGAITAHDGNLAVPSEEQQQQHAGSALQDVEEGDALASTDAQQVS
jgi:autophagy-related protein 11